MKNYLSALGHKKLTDELEFLLKVERPKVCDVVAWAASLGDRSENADYQYGKKRLREIDRRVRFLSSRLADFEIVEISKQSGDSIKFGASVQVLIDGEEEKKFIILGPDEVETSLGRISFLSPIGKGLMGKKVGDVIDITTPNGEHEFEVLRIDFIDLQEE